jgi:hypothetical protein
MDVLVLMMALIDNLDKIGSPIARLIFASWFADHSQADLIAAGMFWGMGFGAIGGLYLLAWNVERAFRNSPYHEPVERTLNWISVVYLLSGFFVIAVACWQALSLRESLSDPGAIGVVLASGIVSGCGSLSLYAVFGWIAYWGVMTGHRLWGSFARLR